MTAIRFDRVSFAYGDAAPILEEVTFDVRGPGLVGLVGANGAGKSTLLRLVAGDLAASEGSVRVEPRGAKVVVCEQSAEGSLEAARALAEDASRAAVRLRARLRLDPATLDRFATASPGERRRWQIGAALAGDPDVLLLDEPTNHLDVEARAIVAEALASFEGLGLVVSHDRAFLDRATHETLRVEGGRVTRFPASYSAARAAWDVEIASARAEREERKRELRRAERSLDRARRVHAAADRNVSSGVRCKDPRDHDAKSMGAKVIAGWAEARHGRSVATLGSARDRAEVAVREARVPVELGRDVSLRSSRASSQRLVSLVLDELRAGDRLLAERVHVTVDRGERIRLGGPNGAGKSTLLRALHAACTLPEHRVVYVPQEISDARAQSDLVELTRAPPDVRGATLALFAALGASPDRLLASRAPSPGEAKKLALARALAGEAWLCLLDEPENHLDLPTVLRLEAALASFEGALILVTHDEALARAVTTTEITIGSRRGVRLD